ncbi:MAG TPA: hypothetical protein VGI10_18130 [Polyangiaceae bacterium]|jgi:hypothetical protein
MKRAGVVRVPGLCGLALFGALGCSGSVDQHGTAANTAGICSPLDPITTSVTLDPASIVDAGRDTDGTTYVATEQDSALRLFTGSGSPLVEQIESGTGEGSDGTTQFWTFSYTDLSGTNVTVQKDASGLRMGVAKGPISGKGFDVGSTGDVLDQLDFASAAAIPAETTQTFSVDYSGALADGRQIVVVAPVHFTSYDGFRVFFGQSTALDEELVSTVTRTLGIPSTTTITLTIDGAPATLSYSVGSGTLAIGSGMSALTSPSLPAAPPGAVFVCR